MASSGKNKSKSASNGNGSNPAKSMLQGKNLEIIVAALLLTGKLRVDSVQLFREATMIIGLTGKYKTIANMSNSNVDKMMKFLDDNGNMTLGEVIEAIKKKTE